MSEAGKDKQTPARAPARVPAVDQACRVLRALGRAEGATLSLTEVSRAVGLHKSRVYYLLASLARAGMVSRDETSKVYSLGPGLIFLGRRALDSLDFGRAAETHLKSLAKTTGATVFAGARNSGRLVVLARARGNEDIGFDVRPGRGFALETGAHGRVMAAFWIPGDEPFPAAIPEEKLAPVRERGWSLDPGVIQPGVNALAAPVFDHTGRVAGVVVLLKTGPPKETAAFGEAVAQTARRISQALGLM